MKAPLIAAVAALSILTGGCVSKLAEGRVRSALVDAGLSRPTAACMAERMTDRLSISQLRRLESLAAHDTRRAGAGGVDPGLGVELGEET